MTDCSTVPAGPFAGEAPPYVLSIHPFSSDIDFSSTTLVPASDETPVRRGSTGARRQHALDPSEPFDPSVIRRTVSATTASRRHGREHRMPAGCQSQLIADEYEIPPKCRMVFHMKDEVSTAGLPRPKAQPNPKQEQQPLRRYPLRTPTPRPHQQHQQTDSLDQPPRSTRSVTFAEPDQPRSMPCSPSPSPPTSSSRAWSEAAPVGFMEASVHSSPPPPYIESMTMAGLGTTLATPMSLELRSAPIGSQRAEAPHLVRRQSLSDLAKSPLTDLAPSSTCSPSSSSQSEFREPPSPPGNVAQRQQEQQQQLQNQKLRGHRRNQSAPTLSASAKAKAEAALSSPMTSSLTASGAKKSGNRFSRLWKSLAHRYSHPAHTVVSAVHCSTIDKMSPGEHDPIGVTTVQSNGRRSELQPLVT